MLSQILDSLPPYVFLLSRRFSFSFVPHHFHTPRLKHTGRFGEREERGGWRFSGEACLFQREREAWSPL